jgi:NADH-quinone oxidoreductase subunit N
MADVGGKLWLLLPEIWLFAGVVVVSVLGLSPRRIVRDAIPLVTCIFLAVAFGITQFVYASPPDDSAGLLMPMLGRYVKMIVCVVGIMLAMLATGLIDRRMEAAVRSGRASFDPNRANRGEFFAFFLLSLIGVMLTCNASDLIWLFLALELTSLPTYIMVAISRPPRKAQEAAVKYFFLGAMAAATFLFGFALLYGATGTLQFAEMREVFRGQLAAGGMSLVGVIGMILAVLGICFKIAAVPMHFYAADVYEGAAAPVTAFLAFVPKTAGMVAIITLLATVDWHMQLPGGRTDPVLTTLWMLAVLTMTLGNVGALLQSSVKRMLAYSSIAHSGYMLIGVIAGPGRGVQAVLFYLLAYGVMNTAAFAVLSGLERKGQEIETFDDLAGMRHRHAIMATVMAVSAGSLLGLPPLLGFIGKLYLFIAGVEADQIALVVIAAVNSAISAWYYLRLVGLPILAKPSAQAETVVPAPAAWGRLAAVVGSVALVVVPIFSQGLLRASSSAMDRYEGPTPEATAEEEPIRAEEVADAGADESGG